MDDDELMIKIKRILSKARKYYEDEIQKIGVQIESKILEEMFDDGGYARNQIVQMVQEGVYREVYDSYRQPVVYNRREDSNGGLADEDNIVTEFYSDGNGKCGFSIWNKATGNPAFSPTDSDLEGIVLNGGPYHYQEAKGHGVFRIPRDFYAVLKENWNKGEFIKSHSDGLVQTELDKIADSVYDSCLERAYEQEGGI